MAKVIMKTMKSIDRLLGGGLVVQESGGMEFHSPVREVIITLPRGTNKVVNSPKAEVHWSLSVNHKEWGIQSCRAEVHRADVTWEEEDAVTGEISRHSAGDQAWTTTVENQPSCLPITPTSINVNVEARTVMITF